MQYHCNADDTQIYITVERDDSIVAGLSKVEACVAAVAGWREIKQLKLNVEKSEAIIFVTAKQRVDLPAEVSLTIAEHRIIPKSSVRILGVLFDSGLTMEAHIAQIAKLSYYQMCNIWRMWSSITDDACKTQVHALVTFCRQSCSVCNVCKTV